MADACVDGIHGPESAIWELSRNCSLGCHPATSPRVFVGDHRQTPGGLAKGRLATANSIHANDSIHTRLLPTYVKPQ